MAKNVEVQYDETTGMLHFIVDPTLVVGEAKSGSEYVCQSERFGEDVPNTGGAWKFNLAVWIKAGQPVAAPKTEPVSRRREGASPFVMSKAKAPAAPAAPRRDIAPGKSQTVQISRHQG